MLEWCSGRILTQPAMPLFIADPIERGSVTSVPKLEGSDHLFQASSRPCEVRVGVEDRHHGISKHTHTTIISSGRRSASAKAARPPPGSGEAHRVPEVKRSTDSRNMPGSQRFNGYDSMEMDAYGVF